MKKKGGYNFEFLAQTHILGPRLQKMHPKYLILWVCASPREHNFGHLESQNMVLSQKFKIVTPFLFQFQAQFLFYIFGSDPYFGSQRPKILLAWARANSQNKVFLGAIFGAWSPKYGSEPKIQNWNPLSFSISGAVSILHFWLRSIFWVSRTKMVLAQACTSQ